MERIPIDIIINHIIPNKCFYYEFLKGINYGF